MFNTDMSKRIVTNLRIDEQDWLQLKSTAAEEGMSVNEYLNLITQNAVSKARFGYPKQSGTKKKRRIYDLLTTLSGKKYHKKTFEVSEDDKLIYGL